MRARACVCVFVCIGRLCIHMYMHRLPRVRCAGPHGRPPPAAAALRTARRHFESHEIMRCPQADGTGSHRRTRQRQRQRQRRVWVFSRAHSDRSLVCGGDAAGARPLRSPSPPPRRHGAALTFVRSFSTCSPRHRTRRLHRWSCALAPARPSVEHDAPDPPLLSAHSCACAAVPLRHVQRGGTEAVSWSRAPNA